MSIFWVNTVCFFHEQHLETLQNSLLPKHLSIYKLIPHLSTMTMEPHPEETNHYHINNLQCSWKHPKLNYKYWQSDQDHWCFILKSLLPFWWNIEYVCLADLVMHHTSFLTTPSPFSSNAFQAKMELCQALRIFHKTPYTKIPWMPWWEKNTNMRKNY